MAHPNDNKRLIATLTKRFAQLAKGTVIAAMLLVPAQAFTAPVTIGSLSSNDDGSTAVINDSLNNLQWLRWDQLRGASFNSVNTAIAPGNAYDGWAIAGLSEAQMFADALWGPGNCPPGGPCVFSNYDVFTSLVGENYLPGAANWAFFHEDSGNPLNPDVGFVLQDRNRTSGGLVLDRFGFFPTQLTLAGSDISITNGSGGAWLMYRAIPAVAPVPLPAPALLLLGGLSGLGAMSVSGKRRARR